MGVLWTSRWDPGIRPTLLQVGVLEKETVAKLEALVA